MSKIITKKALMLPIFIKIPGHALYLFILFKVDNDKEDTVYKNTYKIAWG